MFLNKILRIINATYKVFALLLKFAAHVVKKIVKGILYLIALNVVIAAIVGIYNLDLLGRKPFKFEQFKSKEAALSFFEEKFPKGSNALEMMEFIKAAGGRCSLDKGPKLRKEFHYDKLYICGYENNWISRDPMASYTIYIFTNDIDRVVYLNAMKRYMHI